MLATFSPSLPWGDFILFGFRQVAHAQPGAELCYVAKDTLELLIFLSLPSECWDYRHTPLYLEQVPGTNSGLPANEAGQLSYIPNPPWTAQGPLSFPI